MLRLCQRTVSTLMNSSSAIASFLKPWNLALKALLPAGADRAPRERRCSNEIGKNLPLAPKILKLEVFEGNRNHIVCCLDRVELLTGFIGSTIVNKRGEDCFWTSYSALLVLWSAVGSLIRSARLQLLIESLQSSCGGDWSHRRVACLSRYPACSLRRGC